MAGGRDAQDAVAEAFLRQVLAAREAIRLRTGRFAGDGRGGTSGGPL